MEIRGNGTGIVFVENVRAEWYNGAEEDMLLGWGVQDESLTGIAGMFVYGMLIAKCFLVFGNPAWVNGIDCAWIHIGALWTFGGLLVMMRKVRK